MCGSTPLPSNQANFEMFRVKDLDTCILFVVFAYTSDMFITAMEKDFVSLSVENPIMENKKGHTTAL